MSHFPKSLIGLLEPDGRTFRARLCHSDGYPTCQVPALGVALHKYYDSDLDRLVQDILRHDWDFIAPDEATVDAQESAPGSRKAQPFAGVGYYLTGFDTAPRSAPSTRRSTA
ncbi:hypothetical protein [Prauserella muralis]|uniref:Uncharacterized protein n=1 Tax=Prauserella muralis TaxID=588067 RepID=A0A2V4B8G1_9PSEU|nr:hypothetical protein [Prauserella muralis]PXY25445.1 hypothetical protein BAY60_18905 [Prauserella muralis]TWE27569.1 hypothetical protein FHX69_0205 [Prauserella muralis]